MIALMRELWKTLCINVATRRHERRVRRDARRFWALFD